MPVISRIGNIAMGIDGTVSVNGSDKLLIPQEGHAVAWGRQWLTADEVLTQDGVQLIAINWKTHAVRVLDPNPANDFYAGAGKWASWCAYDPHVARQWGYRDAYGKTDWEGTTKVRDWHPIAVDDMTGTIALLQYGQRGEGLAFWDGVTLRPLLDGPLWPAMNSFHDGEFAGTLSDGRTIRVWKINGTFRDLPMSRLWGSVLSKGMRVGLYDNSFLSVCREEETSGLILSKEPFDFNPDVLATDDQHVHVATSQTAGERFWNIRNYDVDLVAKTVNGKPGEWADLTQPLPVEPPIEPPVTPDPPAVTIRSYAPTSGNAPLSVKVVAALELRSGPVTTLEWLRRPEGQTAWTIDATTASTVLEHTYQFPSGVWFIAVKALGPGGTGQTQIERKVTVTARPVTPPTPIPPTPIPPEDNMIPCALQTSGTKTYVVAQLLTRGMPVDASTTVLIGPWQTWYRVPSNGGKQTLLYVLDEQGTPLYLDYGSDGEAVFVREAERVTIWDVEMLGDDITFGLLVSAGRLVFEQAPGDAPLYRARVRAKGEPMSLWTELKAINQKTGAPIKYPFVMG